MRGTNLAFAADDDLERAVEDCRRGDTAAFGEIYDRFAPGLHATARRMLRRAEDAEDATQDAFVAFCRKLPTLPGARLGGWLHRTLVNACIDRLRRGQRWRSTELTDLSSDPTRPSGGLRMDLDRAVARLPEQARAIFLLHDVEGWTHREIAGSLNLAEGTTKSQLSRARNLLRQLMDGGAPREQKSREN